MNNRSLNDICSDITEFLKLVSIAKERHPLEYSKFLSTATLNNNKIDQPEDYMDAVKADFGKFSTHADMLQHPSDLIQDSGTNSKVVTEAAQRLNQHVETYRAFTTKVVDKDLVNKNLHDTLTSELGNIDKVLKNYGNNFRSPPRNS